MLKRYKEYSNKEMAAMSQEDIEKLIDIECMVNGVTPLTVEPVNIEVPEIPEPDVQVYCINADKMFFTDFEEAKAIADLINRSKSIVDTNYDYLAGYNKRYIIKNRNVAVVETEHYYSKEEYDQLKDTMISAEKTKEKNKSIMDEYKNLTSEYRDLRESVINAYNNALYERACYQNAKNVYLKYLSISNGDKGVANEYFETTDFSKYLKEILEDIEAEEKEIPKKGEE